MQRNRLEFAAETPRAGSRVRLVVGIVVVLLILVGMIILYDRNPDRDRSFFLLYIGFSGCSLLYLLYLLIRPKRLKVDYVLDEQSLQIETEKGTVRLPYAEIEQIAVETFERKLLHVRGQAINGHIRGTFKWNVHALEAIATRQDRMVLLDTRQGLFGLSPASEQEAAFLAELSARTGREVGYGGLHPQHARRMPSLWPLIVSAVGLFLLAQNLMIYYQLHRELWLEVVRLVMVIALVLSSQLLYPLHQRVPWLLSILAVPLVVMAFWVMTW